MAPGDARTVPPPSEEAALRAEHDELAGRVAARRSIDDVRKGAYAAFGLVMSAGLTVKFAWDRWGWGPRPTRPPGRYPLLFLVALGSPSSSRPSRWRAFRRARARHAGGGRGDFARLREIRGRLGIDA